MYQNWAGLPHTWREEGHLRGEERKFWPKSGLRVSKYTKWQEGSRRIEKIENKFCVEQGCGSLSDFAPGNSGKIYHSNGNLWQIWHIFAMKCCLANILVLTTIFPKNTRKLCFHWEKNHHAVIDWGNVWRALYWMAEIGIWSEGHETEWGRAACGTGHLPIGIYSWEFL